MTLENLHKGKLIDRQLYELSRGDDAEALKTQIKDIVFIRPEEYPDAVPIIDKFVFEIQKYIAEKRTALQAEFENL